MTKLLINIFILFVVISSVSSNSVFVRNDSVVIYANIYLQNYPSTCGEYIDGSAFKNVWKPQYDCDPRPTTRSTDYTRNPPFAHFHILSSTGDCLWLDGRLTINSGLPLFGNYVLKMTIPIDEIITENNIKFEGSSQYHNITLYSEPGFDSTLKLERNETYTFKLSSWTNNCETGESQVFTTPLVLEIPCCVGFRGNIDNSSDNIIDIGDLIYLGLYMYQGGPEPPCMEEGDVNGSGGIDVSDQQYLVEYMFNHGPEPVSCP